MPESEAHEEDDIDLEEEEDIASATRGTVTFSELVADRYPFLSVLLIIILVFFPTTEPVPFSMFSFLLFICVRSDFLPKDEQKDHDLIPISLKFLIPIPFDNFSLRVGSVD